MANVSDLMKTTAGQMGATALAVSAGSDVQNAETDGSTLAFNASFISSVEATAGEDGVRFVVAHELGHQIWGMDQCGHQAEFMADEYATRCLVEMGAEYEAIDNVMSMLYTVSPDANETHPAALDRGVRARGVFASERRKQMAEEGDDIDVDDKKTNPNVKDLAL